MSTEQNTTLKSPQDEPEPDNPTPIQPAKPISFSNGVLKLKTPHAPPYAPHAPPHAPHAPPHAPHAPYSPSTYSEYNKHRAPYAPGVYMECLKNHAAAMGGNAVDGCGEFMPPSLSTPSLLCAACGCHRNFHRLSPRASPIPHVPPHLPLLEYRPHHRHRPSPPRSPSPPPISSSYMLLSLSSPNPTNPKHLANGNGNSSAGGNSKKRFRTRFTPIQKEKMYELAEKLTWKMQRRDEEMIHGFCEKIGVEKGVFKVWMHNNKNTRGGKKETVAVNGVVGNGINLEDYRDNNSNSTDEVSGHHVGTNGSSSCS